jgi:hypothetical protein
VTFLRIEGPRSGAVINTVNLASASWAKLAKGIALEFKERFPL